MKTTLVLATRNRHKVQEIQSILGDQFDYLDLQVFSNAPQLIEDGPTFAGNASRKAVQLAQWLANLTSKARPHHSRESRMFCLADDSGLEVDALQGAPGVHSARFAALNSTSNAQDSDNNAKLLRLLENVEEPARTARFRCVIALTEVPEDPPQCASPVCAATEAELNTCLFEGACEGHILKKPQGLGGFGYDPLFVPIGYRHSFAELGEEIKNSISHRSRALQALKAAAAKLFMQGPDPR